MCVCVFVCSVAILAQARLKHPHLRGGALSRQERQITAGLTHTAVQRTRRPQSTFSRKAVDPPYHCRDDAGALVPGAVDSKYIRPADSTGKRVAYNTTCKEEALGAARRRTVLVAFSSI